MSVVLLYGQAKVISIIITAKSFQLESVTDMFGSVA